MIVRSVYISVVALLNIVRCARLLFILLSLEFLRLGLILGVVDQWVTSNIWPVIVVLVIGALEAATGLALVAFLVRRRGRDHPDGVSLTKT